MIMKKLTIAAAVAGALAAGSASAAIIGVPSEGVLMPFGVNGINEEPGVSLQATTGVLLHTPALVGTDTVTNLYTAPNTTPGGYTPPADMLVHYYMFDERSEHVFDATFPMTPNDTYLWLPPGSILGLPNPATQGWIGYVVFADEAARKGGPATFVMHAQGGVLVDGDGWVATDEAFAIATAPLSDGDDAGGIRIGNEITYSAQQLPRIDDVVPLVAGVRYSGAPGATTTIVTGLTPLPLAWTGAGLVMNHIMWFSENDMTADIDFCDDDEHCVSCTSWTFDEVNMLSYDAFGDMWDGVAIWKEAMAFQSSADTPAWGGPDPVGNNCGVVSNFVNRVGPAATLAEQLAAFSAAPGVGVALYEFANRAGVAGFNQQIAYGGDDLTATVEMLANGQF